ncbi:ubiquinone biosynthesis O-methyltransferase, mitochondrial isoform X2 [Folsomia candida]|uniref:ubiquinone biosynthesis O-methyltransferase, mitochondrial isoform X2 n=1 Tax=Folsomia candida TaxID=158441 RepID=UPI001604CED8|nr:ubiquinone biosynthesis O-methyltransferase, mitochondrial isoform X2 [Folsomia candida]
MKIAMGLQILQIIVSISFSFANFTEPNKTLETTVSTLNPEEVEKFGKLSAEWWSPSGPLRSLHAMNSIRVPYIASTLNCLRDGRKRRILDIGSGGGFLSEGLAEHFQNLGWSDTEIEIVGLEPNSELVNIARSHLPENLKGKVNYFVDTVENYVVRNPNQNFDTVVMSEVIEHVDNPAEFLKYAVRAAKPGGSIYLSTPGKSVFSWMTLILLMEHVLRIFPVGTHNYDKLIDLNDTLAMLRENKCEIREVRGSLYNPLLNVWHWNDLFIPVAYAVHAVKSN